VKAWNGLPEWARWILCWPIILAVSLAAYLVGAIMADLAVDRILIPDELGDGIAPAMASLISLPALTYAIQYFVPRKQHYVVAVLCVLYLLATVAGTYWQYVEITQSSAEVWMTLRDVAWGALGLAVVAYFFIKIKNEDG
jgi:hypothetical protein